MVKHPVQGHKSPFDTTLPVPARRYGNRSEWSLILLSTLVLLIYGNSFQASWHLDDYHTIVNNPRLHISDLSPATLWQTLHAHHSKGAYDSDRLYRPVACFTFALNWFAAQDRVGGYHAVNIGIHLATAAALYHVILLLLQSPALKSRYAGAEHFIALLTAALWAVNPIHTQAITYIVQRMAAMAAMFYLMGIGFYLKGRLRQGSRLSGIPYYIYAAICFLLALGSKENAVVWPAAIVLIEIVFFQDMTGRRDKIRWAVIFSGGLLAVALFGTVVFLNGQLNSILHGYADRPFTVGERLLTQPRVLLFYLSQIFYPIPQRLSIEHDILASTAWFQPWTTLPALLMVCGLVGWSMLQLKKRPIISFALLFFFLNHLIESSVLGLELVFEHRNYLPSAFLFLPIAVFVNGLLQRFDSRQKAMFALTAAFVVLVIMGFGIGTHSRNRVWANEKSLWTDALAKAPKASRPYHQLAWGHYQKIGDYQKAIDLYVKALQRSRHRLSTEQTLLGNIAGMYYTRRQYADAVRLWQHALAIRPENENIRYRLSCGLIKRKDFTAALTHLNHLIEKRPDHPNYLGLKGYVLVKQQRFAEALKYLQQALALQPSDLAALVNKGACLNQMGEFMAARPPLRLANGGPSENAVALLWLIDTHLKIGRHEAAGRGINRMLDGLTLGRLDGLLASRSEDFFILFPRSEILYQSIAQSLKRRALALAGEIDDDAKSRRASLLNPSSRLPTIQ